MSVQIVNIEHKNSMYRAYRQLINQSMFTMYDMSSGLLYTLLDLQENTHPRIFQY